MNPTSSRVARDPLSFIGRSLLVCIAGAFPLTPGHHARAQEAASPPSAAATTLVEFSLTPVGELNQLLSGVLELAPSDAPGEVVNVQVRPGQRTSATLTAGKSWDLRVVVPGTWAFRQVLNLRPGEAQRNHVVQLWPLGRAEGRLVLPEDGGLELPTALEMAMEPPPHRKPSDRTPWGGITCPVGVGGSFSCDLPAAELDLTLRAQGFAPIYFWGHKITAGKARVLGDLSLRRGASLGGWAVVEGAEADLSDAVAELKPSMALGTGSAEASERLKRLAQRVPLDAGGFFHFQELAPGTYDVEVSGAGLAAGSLKQVSIVEGEQILLREPLRLRGAVRLEVLVQPPEDVSGHPWLTRLLRIPHSAGEARSNKEALTDPAGLALYTGQLPGTFWLDVQDAAGNVVYSKMDLQLGGDAPVQVAVELDLVQVSGRVSLGREALEATLWFGSKHGAPRIRIEADEEGDFAGTLPRPGLWPVDVEAALPTILRTVRVDVAAGGSRAAKLRIRLPDTEVHGRVYDPEGRPVEGATVHATADRELARETTGPRGQFRLRALAIGTVVLAAKLEQGGETLASELSTLELEEGEPAGPVELHLKRNRTFSGTVSSRGGPLAGARVMVSAHRPRLPFASTSRTGPDGRFEAKVSSAAQWVVAVVSAPGWPLKAFEAALTSNPVTLSLGEQGGSLAVSVPFDSDELLRSGRELLVFQDGLQLALGELAAWARLQGHTFLEGPKTLRVPALAAGHYRVCAVQSALLGTWDQSTGPPPGAQCDEGFLAGGSELELEIPGE